jgi:hypothetical protein
MTRPGETIFARAVRAEVERAEAERKAARHKPLMKPVYGLGLHWLWFVPLCALVLLLVEQHTVVFGLDVLKLAGKRWDWGALISPSAAFCLSVIVASVVFPLKGMWVIGLLVANRPQWRWIILLAIIIFLSPLVTDLLIWGSFPLTFDNEGVGRLRMIPFIPWPSVGYLEF